MFYHCPSESVGVKDSLGFIVSIHKSMAFKVHTQVLEVGRILKYLVYLNVSQDQNVFLLFEYWFVTVIYV